MSGPSEWTWEENKVFEHALAMHYDFFEKGEWEKLAVLITTKTPTQISSHHPHDFKRKGVMTMAVAVILRKERDLLQNFE